MSVESALWARSWVSEFVPLAAMWLVEGLTGGRVACRECGARVAPGLVAAFVTEGCTACGSQKLRLEGGRVWRAVLLVLAPVLMVAALAALVPVGCDYPIFKRAALAWVSGSSRLYDAESLGFFYAPWSIPLFVVLAWLPDWVSSGIINGASIAALVAAVWLLIGKAPWWAVVIALSNIYTANLIGSTQVDAFVVLAVSVAYRAVRVRSAWALGLAVAIVGMKPTNAWVPLALIVLGAFLARWSWREWLAAAAIPAACLVLSVPVAGLMWPTRYVEFIMHNSPNAGYNVAFFRSADVVQNVVQLTAVAVTVWALVLHVKRAGLDGVSIALGLVVNLMLSPYVTIYHYVAAVPVVVWLGRRDSLWLVWTYAASVLWVTVRDPWLPLFPLAVAVAVLVAEIRDMVPVSSPVEVAA